MPFDPYALCPGGRDKKIRFCCPNMLKELEQVVRLLESEQPTACLSYIETLEKTHPDCACLTKAKLSIYRAENRWQDVLPVAEQFYAREPDNPAAAAEYALALVITGNPKLAVSTLVDAFERTDAGTVHSTLLQSALQVAAYLMLGGLVTSAIAIGHVLKEIPATSESANLFLYRATSEADTPLRLRDWTFDFDCPDGFPGKEAFEEAAVLIRLMRWKQALALLEPLTQHAGVWSGIWRNIATVQLWLLEQEKSSEALKTYASLPNTPLEDAVDAEVLRMFFAPDAFGDQTQMLAVEYTITDADKALEALLSSPRFQHIDLPLNASLSPPPRGLFMLLDSPFPSPETQPALENWPSLHSIAALFGKETDREARLFLQSLPAYERDCAEQVIRDALGDFAQFPGEVVSENITSRTRILSENRVCFPPPGKLDLESFKRLSEEYYATKFVESWMALPLGLLDGKTPGEAAKEPQYTISLLAAIHVIETWLDKEAGFGKDVRSRLGLPAEETITVAENTDAEDPLSLLDVYPVWRWHRFDVSKLSTEVLAGGMQIVLGMQELRTAAQFAEELLSRPLDSMEFAIRVMAFESLIAYTQADNNFEQALLWVERAKSESVAKDISAAAWYFHEITLHLTLKNGQAASEAIAYLLKNHGNDPRVMESLQELFVQLGMFNPDGTPSAAWTQAISAQTQAASVNQPEGQPLWTPNSALPPSGAAPSKLWVPD